MTGFLEQFFPETIGKESTQAGDLYCTYNNQKIQWFTSSLFLAGAATELSGTTGQSPPQHAAPSLPRAMVRTVQCRAATFWRATRECCRQMASIVASLLSLALAGDSLHLQSSSRLLWEVSV